MSETENNDLTAGKQSKEPRSNQKLKLLYLAKILLNNTDANHDITLDEILDKLLKFLTLRLHLHITLYDITCL